LKSLYACRVFALDKRFSMTPNCDLDLVYVPYTAAHSGDHLYEVSLEPLRMCRRYALDKISIFYHL
jgi:hypothetical protein